MKIPTWNPDMRDSEAKDVAYWERNVLALKYADGWYYDDTFSRDKLWAPRYPGWGRVLSLSKGAITFHIPDDFEVGNLPEIERNWDGHSTHEKWARILSERGIAV